MKLTTFILILGTLQLSATVVFSQDNKLNLKVERTSIAEVLTEIENQSAYKFAFSSQFVDMKREVTLEMENVTMSQALEALFADTNVDFRIENQFVILVPKVEDAKSGVRFANLQQQGKTVTGKVVDENGEPIPGASIVLKGTSTGTISDMDGNFTLSGVPEDATLQFSFVGMRTVEISVGNQARFEVVMVQETIGLEEVVAIGYGTMKVREVTSAVSSVKSDDFVKGSVSDASQLVRGKVAGLIVTTSSADPTSTAQINLRGITTLVSGTSPLVLINGVPGSLNEVAPENIESIDVLKDGSAAAIYGTRGTNGVILITTRKVTGESPTVVELNSYMNVQKITKRLDFMSASEYRELVTQNKPGAIDYGYDTDWLDQILQTPISQVHNVSLRGGSKNTTYVANLNY